MAKEQRTRAQHYVPQFILRGFTNNKKKMFCYDKASDRIYPTCPADAAQETDFYECPPGTTKGPMEVNAVENQLGKLESAYKPIIERLIKAADAGKIDPDLLDHFSPFVAIQWMRTKTYRETAYETIMKAGQTLVDDLTRVNFPDVVGKLRFSVGKEGMSAFHAEHMLNPDTILRMARDLDRHIWAIGINKTDRLFGSGLVQC